MIVACKLVYESAPETGSYIIDTSKLSNQKLIKAFNTKENVCFGYPKNEQDDDGTSAFFDDDDWEEFQDDLLDAELNLPANVKKQVGIWVY